MSLEIKRGADRVWGWGGGDACSCYNVPESRSKKEPLLQITALLTGLSLLRLCSSSSSSSSSSSCSSCILFSPLPTTFLPRRCQDRMSRFGLEFNDCCTRTLLTMLCFKKDHPYTSPTSFNMQFYRNTKHRRSFHGIFPRRISFERSVFCLDFSSSSSSSSHLLRRGGGNNSRGSLLLLKNGRLKRRGVRGGEGWIYGRQVD